MGQFPPYLGRPSQVFRPGIWYHALPRGLMFAVTRTYTGASALIDAIDRRRAEVEGVITTVPGFVSYFASRSGDSLTTITVCDDQSGCDETTRRAAAWVRENLPDAKIAAPTVNAGEVFITLSGRATPALGTASVAHA